MKRKIRRNVFETNSSSTHSFTYGNTNNDLVVQDDDYVHTSLGEYGWQVEDYSNSRDKLAYILLVAASFNGVSFWYDRDTTYEEKIETLKESEDFQRIEDAVKYKMNCEGIIIDEYAEGYIDHQSLWHDSFGEWLDDTGASDVEDFIFGNVVLHTDNDNY